MDVSDIQVMMRCMHVTYNGMMRCMHVYHITRHMTHISPVPRVIAGATVML